MQQHWRYIESTHGMRRCAERAMRASLRHKRTVDFKLILWAAPCTSCRQVGDNCLFMIHHSAVSTTLWRGEGGRGGIRAVEEKCLHFQPSPIAWDPICQVHCEYTALMCFYLWRLPWSNYDFDTLQGVFPLSSSVAEPPKISFSRFYRCCLAFQRPQSEWSLKSSEIGFISWNLRLREISSPGFPFPSPAWTSTTALHQAHPLM